MKDFEIALSEKDPTFSKRIAGRIVWGDVEALYSQKYSPRFAVFHYLRAHKDQK